MANIGTTTAFYKVEASLSRANEEVSKSMERLATGRQNANAGDRSSYVAMADTFRLDYVGTKAGIKGASVVKGYLETAMATLDAASGLLSRLQELAILGANDTNTTADARAIDAEAEAIAMKKFESSTLRAQQSAELEDLSDIQRGGSFAKLFTMFMTSPNQYYRMWMSGYRNLMAGRGTISENVRKIFVAQFLLPSMFTWIANGFEYDEEDQILSLVLSPFYGIMFFGQAIETIVQTLGGKRYGKAGEISILDPFNDANKSLGRMRQIYLGKKDLDTKNTWYIINNFLLAITKVLGLPYAGIKRTFFGSIKVAKGEAEKPIREAIGFRFDNKKTKKQSQTKVVIMPKIEY